MNATPYLSNSPKDCGRQRGQGIGRYEGFDQTPIHKESCCAAWPRQPLGGTKILTRTNGNGISRVSPGNLWPACKHIPRGPVRDFRPGHMQRREASTSQSSAKTRGESSCCFMTPQTAPSRFRLLTSIPRQIEAISSGTFSSKVCPPARIIPGA